MDNVLTPIELSELRQLEDVIQTGLATFYHVGRALLDIREKRLYRLTHENFEAYCRQRWKFGRTKAHRLIESALVVDNLATNCPPIHESQLRPMTALEQEQQRKIWEVATSNGQQPTAALVQQLVEKARSGQELSIEDEEQITNQQKRYEKPEPKAHESREELLDDAAHLTRKLITVALKLSKEDSKEVALLLGYQSWVARQQARAN